LSALLLPGTSCGRSEPTQATSTLAALPLKNRGALMPVGTLSLSTTVRWGDATEIVYTTVDAVSGIAELRGVHPENLHDRRIQRANVRGTRYENLGLPTGAGALFLTESVGPGMTLSHRVNDTTSVALTARPALASRVRNSAFGVPVLPTRDGTAAAYLVRPDSVRLYDVRTRSSRTLANGCVGLLSFSPDGSELLFGRRTMAHPRS